MHLLSTSASHTLEIQAGKMMEPSHEDTWFHQQNEGVAQAVSEE